jgi:hypothetical protein
VADTSPADWVRDRIGDFGSGVCGVLPHGYDAYARLLHPASSPGNVPVRWSEVAAWAGRTLGPEDWFEDIASPANGVEPGPRPWNGEPAEDKIPEHKLAVLCEVLARHTSSEHGWFCLWDGWGNLSGHMSVVLGYPADNLPPPGTPSRFQASPASPEEVLNGPRVELPHREYLLFEGPLEAVNELGGSISHGPYRRVETQPPNLFWPYDHAWCVATEIDFDFTCFGGTPTLIDELLTVRISRSKKSTSEAADCA